MKKKYWIPLAALAAVVILALALWPRSHWVQVVNADNRDEKTLVLWDGDVIAEYEGEYWAARYNMAGDRAVFRLLGETRDEDRACLVEKGRVTILGDRAASVGISPSGQGAVYIDRDDRIHLYLDGTAYDLNETIQRNLSVKISPDGGTLGFTRPDGTACLFRDGQVRTFGENLAWAAIGEKYLYFYDLEEETYYVQQGWDENTRLALPAAPYLGNRDMSQMMLGIFSEEEGWHTWLLRDGRELTELGIQDWIPLETVWEDGYPYMADREDLRGMLFWTVDDRPYSQEGPPYQARDPEPRLCRMDKNYQPEVLMTQVVKENLFLSEDGKYLYHHSKHDKCLYQVDISSGEMTLASDMVKSVRQDPQGSGIYFSREGSKGIWYCSGRGEPWLLPGSENWSEPLLVEVDGTDFLLIQTLTDREASRTGTWTVYLAKAGKLRSLFREEHVKRLNSERDPLAYHYRLEHPDGTVTEYIYPKKDLPRIWRWGR